MFQRVAHVLFVAMLVSAEGSAPFAHIHPSDHQDAAPEPAEALAHSAPEHHHPQSQGAHSHPTRWQTAEGPGSTTLVGKPHHSPPVPIATVAVERPSVRAAATPALTAMWAPDSVPVPPSRPVPVAANARPNPPPPVTLAARAPPVVPRTPYVG